VTSLNPLLTVGRQLVQTIPAHLDVSPYAARERAVQLLAEVGIPAASERLGGILPFSITLGLRRVRCMPPMSTTRPEFSDSLSRPSVLMRIHHRP